MTESTYDTYFFYKSGLLEIIKIQTYDILILVNNDFASNEKKVIKIAKLIIKDCNTLLLYSQLSLTG